MTAPATIPLGARVLLGYGAVLVLFCGVAVSLSDAKLARERKAWLAFKASHHCKAVTHRDGEMITVVSPEAKGPDTVTRSMSRGRTGWLCDDGVVHEADDE